MESALFSFHRLNILMCFHHVLKVCKNTQHVMMFAIQDDQRWENYIYIYLIVIKGSRLGCILLMIISPGFLLTKTNTV